MSSLLSSFITVCHAVANQGDCVDKKEEACTHDQIPLLRLSERVKVSHSTGGATLKGYLLKHALVFRL